MRALQLSLYTSGLILMRDCKFTPVLSYLFEIIIIRERTGLSEIHAGTHLNADKFERR